MPGRVADLEGLVSLERDSFGVPLGVRGVVRDVTEQQVTEKALRESEGRYRVVAETASDAIMTIDESTEIFFANPAAEKSLVIRCLNYWVRREPPDPGVLS